jgi:uncharacterized protein (TIGR03382 family)
MADPEASQTGGGGCGCRLGRRLGPSAPGGAALSLALLSLLLILVTRRRA